MFVYFILEQQIVIQVKVLPSFNESKSITVTRTIGRHNYASETMMIGGAGRDNTLSMVWAMYPLPICSDLKDRL